MSDGILYMLLAFGTVIVAASGVEVILSLFGF